MADEFAVKPEAITLGLVTATQHLSHSKHRLGVHTTCDVPNLKAALCCSAQLFFLNMGFA